VQDITIHVRNTDKQPDDTNLCGHYAVAFAVAICARLDPTFLRFDPYPLVEYVIRGLRNGRFGDDLPARHVTCEADLCVLRELKLHCLCQRPYSRTPMVSCRMCHNNYHPSCVSLQYEVCPPLQWQGPCCAGVESESRFVPDPQDEETVTGPDEPHSTSSPFSAGGKGRRLRSNIDLSPIASTETM
jgi:hypothetical protein